METRGRKRKYNPAMPKHINQDKLPANVYWDKSGRGHWYIRFKQDGNPRRQLIGRGDLSLGQITTLAEGFGRENKDTLRYVATKYFEHFEFSQLADKTKMGYQTHYGVIVDYQTKRNCSLADIELNEWKTSLVQKFVDKLADTPSKAKHTHAFIRVLFGWAKRRDYTQLANPAIGVKLPKERKKNHLPTQQAYDKLVNYAKVNATYKQKTKGSVAHYIWAVMEIEYLCRLRGIEARYLTDANVLDDGLLVHRRKGSKTNLTEFNERLTSVIDYLTECRNDIWNIRSTPYPLAPEARPLIVNTVGEVLKESAYHSAWGRFIRMAIETEVIEPSERFSLHELKKKGVTDTQGNQQDKMDASGHRDTRMMEIYDHSIAKVKPASD